MPIPVAALSKGWVCDSSLAGIAGSIPAGPWMSVSCESIVCQVVASATGRSGVQRSPTACGVSECDIEILRTGRRKPTRNVGPWKEMK